MNKNDKRILVKTVVIGKRAIPVYDYSNYVCPVCKDSGLVSRSTKMGNYFNVERWNAPCNACLKGKAKNKEIIRKAMQNLNENDGDDE
jgi:hypothetical protein